MASTAACGSSGERGVGVWGEEKSMGREMSLIKISESLTNKSHMSYISRGFKVGPIARVKSKF
jgi:hypothetical protein